MQWIKASDRMPTEADSADGLVVARWQNELGSRCMEVINFARIRPCDEWLMGAWDQQYGTSGPIDYRNRKHHYADVTWNGYKYYCRVWAFGILQDEYPPEKTLFLEPMQEWGDTSHLEAPCCVVWDGDIKAAVSQAISQQAEEMRFEMWRRKNGYEKIKW